MDLISYTFGAVGGLIILYASVFSGLSRDASLWMNCAGAVLLVIAAFAYMQEAFWVKDKAAIISADATPAGEVPATPVTPASPANLLVPGNKPNPDWVVPPNPNPYLARNEVVEFAVGKPIGVDTIPTDAVRIYAGNALYWTETFPLDFIRQGAEDLITIDMKDDGISLSATLFDSKGQMACTIVDNHFHLNPANYFRPDTLDDRSRLVVHDQEAREILDLEFVNPRAIRFSGDFFIRNGRRIVLKNGVARVGDTEWWHGSAVLAGSEENAFVFWFDVPEGATIPAPADGKRIQILPAPHLRSEAVPADPQFTLRYIKIAEPQPEKPDRLEPGKEFAVLVELASRPFPTGDIWVKSSFEIATPDNAVWGAIRFQNNMSGEWQRVPFGQKTAPVANIFYVSTSKPPDEVKDYVLAGDPNPSGIVEYLYVYHAIRYSLEDGTARTTWFAARYDAKTGETEFIEEFSNIEYELPADGKMPSDEKWGSEAGGDGIAREIPGDRESEEQAPLGDPE